MNRLANEISPYLIQHKDNPVDWYPWNNTAIQKAKAENKPIFLSIGYAACHWCHVMAHESFENETVAQILNQHYISIKVDREERPDIDQIYMSAVVALTGQGGWPLSVFLTPDLKPFYGGTYFPPVQRYGMPSFTDILLGIMQAWQNEPEKIIQASSLLTQHISDNQHLVSKTESTKPESFMAIDSCHTFSNRFDWQHGGWGDAPKFPAPMTIDFLLQCSNKTNLETTEMAFQTLHQMAQGGMYDLVDGGFHRYSTDSTWTVPHFEKMLYDNAQLAITYTHAYQKSANPIFKTIAKDTLNYLLSQMKHPEGAFFSSQDADANGVEGTYYLWTMDELNQHSIPEEILNVVDLPPNGHIDQQYLLKIKNAQKPESKTYADYESISFDILSPLLTVLKSVRAGRPKPAIDDKIILSWNALAINAYLDAGMAFNNPKYTSAAIQCADFLRTNMLHNGHLSHTWRDGKASGLGFLEDYAGFSQALLCLYTATSDPDYFQTAKVLIEKMMDLFAHDSGLLQNTAKTEENLISPVLDFSDMVTPSGMSMAVRALLEYSALNPLDQINSHIDEWLNLTQDQISKHPAAYAYWLQQFLAHQTPQTSFILSYSEDQSEKIEQLRNTFYRQYRPNWIFMAVKWEENNIRQHADILLDKPPVNNDLTLYFCENFTCKQPITDYRQMLDMLN